MIRALLVVLFLAGRVLAQGYVCAEGGGNAGKGAWADEVFGWMVEKGGHGKVVLLGAVKLDEDERPALFTRLGAKSVESLVVTEENADTQATYDAIASASVVFIRGGAQDRYVRWWKGKKTQQAIIAVWKKGGVVAGTSAGCAVLGEVVYDSLHGSLTAREALADGRHEHLSLTTDFLNLVPGVLFDTHFTERGRLARLPLMLAMCKEDLKRDDILGIGVDPRTAVCVGPGGIAEIKGEGTATMLRLTPGSEFVLEKRRPPAVTDVAYTQLVAGFQYDLSRREVVHRPQFMNEVSEESRRERVHQSTVSISGSRVSDEAVGYLYVNEPDREAWLSRTPHLQVGEAKLQTAFLATAAFDDGLIANHMAGALRSGRVGVRMALLVDRDCEARATSEGSISVPIREPCGTSLVLVNMMRSTRQGSDPLRERMTLRPMPAIEDAELDLLAPGWSINLNTREVSH